jgi:hypothetical protein
LAGFPYPVIYDNPNVQHNCVYQVFLCIKHPLITTKIPKHVLDALQKSANRQRRSGNYGLSFAKSSVDAKQWVQDLLDDIAATGGKMSWTVIPDWATKVLQSLGYDGIQDIGGKRGGEGHVVWVPFEETQVKSAISNKKFDPTKKNIHK